MRTGINPYKSLSIGKELNEITMGILVNIPNEEGYYKNAIAVMEDCLRSSKENTRIEFDLLVVDNNSTERVKDILNDYQRKGLIRILILNQTNVGRTNGVRQVLNSSPGKYVGYSDCDIYFKENWLERELELLTKIPKAGFISGMPNRSFTNYFTEFSRSYISESGLFNIDTGKLIPEEYITSFAESLGYEDISEPINKWNKNEDIRISYNGITAYIGASHMQFLTKKELVNKLPEQRFKKLTGCNDEIIDKYVNEFNYLRLSTEHPVIHHMGNKPITSTTEKRIVYSNVKEENYGFIKGFYRKVIGKLYDWSFKKYYTVDRE